MFRSFDIAAMAGKANEMLNDPYLRLLSLKIDCSMETGYTVASMRFSPCEKRETRFERKLERFVVSGGYDPELDNRLSDKNIRLIKQHAWPTSEGTVVVIDYMERKRKAG